MFQRENKEIFLFKKFQIQMIHAFTYARSVSTAKNASLGASLTLLNIALYFYVLFNSYRDVHML